MKPGNKVWYFDGFDILDIIVVGEDSNAIYGQYKVEFKNHVVIGRPIIRIEKPWPVFRTREALCEHYRKIFE